MPFHHLFVTMEENVLNGGLGEHIAAHLSNLGFSGSSLSIGIPNVYVEHGSVDTLKRLLGMDAESIAKKIRERERERQPAGRPKG